MVAIQRRLLQSVNSLIVLLISLLGFATSCNDEPAEYGTPHADFIVYGKIESVTDSQPIPEIIVEMRFVPENAKDTSQSALAATGFSHYTGDYYTTAQSNPKDHTFQIRFVDTDGPLNGEYETLDTTVIFKDPKFVKGDGSWYVGYTEKELNIQLKAKKYFYLKHPSK